MNIKEVLDLLNNDMRKKAEIKRKQKVTIGIAVVVGLSAGGILTLLFQKKSPQILKSKKNKTVKKIKRTINDTIDIVADSADKAEQEVIDVIEKVSISTKDVKNDIAEGLHGITDEIEKSAAHASKKLKKSIK